MQLSENDIKLFYKLNPSLLAYVNIKLDIISGVSTEDEFMSLSIEDKAQLRNLLYDNIELIDSFVNDNPFGFSSIELKIISSWKRFIKGEFFLFRHLKKYSIFLTSDSSPKAFGVLSLTDSMKDIFPNLPVMLDAVLLPFKDQIIYDGFIMPYDFTFGGGISSSLTETYNNAKASYGIITALPFEDKENERDDEDMLKYYLKNEKNRDYYWDEIQNLIYKDEGLMRVFHQETGKSFARKYRKRLREIGINDAWFGILEGLIIASAKTREELKHAVDDIVPSNKTEFVYVFKFKSRQKK